MVFCSPLLFVCFFYFFGSQLVVNMAKFSEEETQEMTAIFEGTGFRPKCGSKEELEESMVEFLNEKGKLPVKPEPGQVTKQILQQPPRVSNFSGDTSKGDAAFDLWEYEVKCLIQVVRRSMSCHWFCRVSLSCPNTFGTGLATDAM